MIEVEYEGPSLRGLIVMVLATIAGILTLIATDNPYTMTWQGWGLAGIYVIGAAIQLLDLRRWSRESVDKEAR